MSRGSQVGVVVPAHNEEQCLGPCLQALAQARDHAQEQGLQVQLLVVLDHCSDRSAAVAAAQGVATLVVAERNVGRARAAGANHLLDQGVGWLAFTDADSRVAPDWLLAQLQLRDQGHGAVCGCVLVDDWDSHPVRVRERYQQHYQHADGHRHVHGANLGVSREAYLQAGGFPPLRVGEDVALVQALLGQGTRLAWSTLPRVHTSSRKDARVRGGFGDFLLGLAEQPVPAAGALAAVPVGTPLSPSPVASTVGCAETPRWAGRV